MSSLTENTLWVSSTFSPEVLFGRLAIAALLGGLIGLEREFQERAAGLRTHILICVAAATFTLITLEIYAQAMQNEGGNADPIRIIEAVTAGVAFLAAGAIFRGEATVRGLTTGAGMWAAGAVGICVGAGYLFLAAAAAAIAFVVLRVLLWLETRLIRNDGD